MAGAIQTGQNTAIAVYSLKSLSLIGVCFILSGATGLIYEVLWARMLGLVFGATTLAVSTVLAAFMGGLALGSALAGRVASRIKRPLSAYGWLEIGVAIYAVLVPFLFHWVDNLYAVIWRQFHPGFFTFSLWRFGLSCLLLLVPTTMMGATAVVADRKNRHSLVIANKAVAARSTDDAAVTGKTFWLVCAFASGFVTISTQVAWTRLLTMIIGSSTYAFSIVVALFLI